MAPKAGVLPPKGLHSKPTSSGARTASRRTTASGGRGADVALREDIAQVLAGDCQDVMAYLGTLLESDEPLLDGSIKAAVDTVLRIATTIVLAGAARGPGANALAWPGVGTVTTAAKALTLLIGLGKIAPYHAAYGESHLDYEIHMDLWTRPGPSLTLTKALAAALRRANDVTVEAEERIAYYMLSFEVMQSYVTAARRAAAPPRTTLSRLQRTTRALIRSGVLQCLSRILAGGQDRHAWLGAESATLLTGFPLARSPLPCLPSLMDFVTNLQTAAFHNTEDENGANSSSGCGGGGRPTSLAQEFLDALADSQLLEHAAKLVHNGVPSNDSTSSSLLRGLLDVLHRLSHRAMFRGRQLPGPCQHFLLTAAAVDALGALDSGPSYGLPAEVAQMAKVLRQRLGTKPLGAIKDVLRCWVLLQTPGAGMPLRSCISPAATYELCMRLCATSVRAALDSGGQTGAGWCHTAVAALVAAHDAMEQRRQQQQAPSVAAGGRASPGPLRDRPHGWWQAGVEALGAVAEATPEEVRGVEGLLGDAELLLSYQLDRGALSLPLPLPGALRTSPPADVASALSSGYLPCLERILRRSQNGLPLLPTLPTSLLRWPQLGWLLAYGDRRQAAALVATVGKLVMTCAGMMKDPWLDVPRRAVQLSLDGLNWLQARREALAAAGGGGEGPGSSNSGAGSSGSNGPEGASSSGIGDGGSDRDSCGAGSSTAAGMGAGGGSSGDGSVASSSGAPGPAQPPEEDAAPGQQLRLMVGYMLAHWLPRLARLGRLIVIVQKARAQRDEPSFEYIRNLLRLLSRALNSCNREELPPAEEDAWAQLLFEQADIMGFLDSVATCAFSGFLQPLEVLQLRRLLRQLLASYPAAMHTELCKCDERAFRAFLVLFGPSGPHPDPQLVGLLEAVRYGGAAGSAEVPPPPPGLPGLQSLLPPLLEVQSLLRVCGNVLCPKMAGDSEAGVKLRKGSGARQLQFCSQSCEQKHRATVAEHGLTAKAPQQKEGGGRRKGR